MAWTNTRARIASIKSRDRDADVTELQRQLKAERLEEYVRKTVDTAPLLTAAQRDRIALALRPIGAALIPGGGDAA